MTGLHTLLAPLFLSVAAFSVTAFAAAPPEPLAPAKTAPLLTASVKLRVDASNSHSWGTGTIVDTRQGEALILTCGHIFRDSQGKGKIEVHLFGENSFVTVLGTCLFYDLEIDLALVAIAPPCPVKAIPIAPANYTVQSSQEVLSVGCDQGANPTVRSHRIMSTDRIGTPVNNALPFHYIQVSGAPVSGRSGGGLFSSDGYLIGVCNTADPVANDGHFVPPQIIRHVLDTMNIAEVYQHPSLGKPAAAEAAMTPQMAGALIPLKPLDMPQPAVAMVNPKYAEVTPSGISKEEQATLEEIKRRKQDGDEVIIIVRPRRTPEVPSDVIVLNGTSEQFLNTLVQETPAESNSYNPVIFSSHSTPHNVPPTAPVRQPVSFPVQH